MTQDELELHLQVALPHLIPEFLQAMDEIGRYGAEKYGENSFQARRKKGDASRYMPRVQSQELMTHASQHQNEYLSGTLHDHFKTRKHQLAAAAFNAMMEFHFANLKEEIC